ncbi:MAG: TAXI family TRAP transporter solute-binding subunit [Alphaproteobacteria bacterium]
MKNARATVILAAIATAVTGTSVHAQMPTLTMEAGQPGGGTDLSAKNLAEVAARGKIATIQVQVGKTLTKSILQVAQGKTDIAASPFTLNFLMSRGLGPYAGLGKEKGKELAGNLRLLYPYHLAHFYLISYQTTGIDSYEKLKGKTVHNGPPRGGALVTARNIIRLVSGLEEGKGYNGKQIAWGQANSIFLDRSVDAAVRPGTNPAAYIPVLMAAGKLNMVSIPKAKFESAGWKKFTSAPGMAPVVFPVSELAHYGDGINVISEDNMFRSAANGGGNVVHKKMDNKLAKALTAAFIKGLPEFKRSVPFAKGLLFGEIDAKKMAICFGGGKIATIKFHPGAIEAWEEAGHKAPDCAR